MSCITCTENDPANTPADSLLTIHKHTCECALIAIIKKYEHLLILNYGILGWFRKAKSHYLFILSHYRMLKKINYYLYVHLCHIILPSKQFQISFLNACIQVIWRGCCNPEAFIDFSWEYSELALSYLNVTGSWHSHPL